MAHYHRSDPIKNLRIRVIVEKVSSGKLKTRRKSKKSKARGKQDFQTLNEVFRWQVKKFSPTEFVRYSSSDPTNRKLAQKVQTLVKNPGHGDASDSDDDENVFTKGPGHDNRSDAVRHEHYTKLQRENLRSLHRNLSTGTLDPKNVCRAAELFTYIDRDGFIPDRPAPLNQDPPPRPTLLDQALTNLSRRGGAHLDDPNFGGTRNHHERDMPFVSMHILLALSDTKEVLSAATKPPPEKDILVIDPLAVDEPPTVSGEELLLCSVRAFHGSNRVVVTPPLNDGGQRRRPDEGDGAWYHCESAVTGDLYRYRITNESDISFRNNVRLSLDLESKEREELAMAAEELVNEVGPYEWDGGLQHANELLRLHAMVEIVSAHKFSALNALYVRYEVVIDDKEWEWPTPDPPQDLDSSGPGSRGVVQMRRPIHKQGISQTVWPVIMRPRRPKPRSAPGTRDTSANDNAFGCGIDPEHDFGLGRVREESVAHICLPIDLELVHVQHLLMPTPKALDHGTADPEGDVTVDMSKNDPSDFSWPQLRLAVYSRSRTDQHQLLAYGYYDLPRTPGFSDDHVSMWKPQTTAWHRFSTFFLGGCLELEDKGFVNQLPANHGVASNFGLRTVSAGSLRIRSNIMIQKRPPRFEGVGGRNAYMAYGPGAPTWHKSTARAGKGRNRQQLGTILEKLREMKTARTAMSGKRLDSTLRDLSMTLAETVDQIKRAKPPTDDGRKHRDAQSNRRRATAAKIPLGSRKEQPHTGDESNNTLSDSN